MPSESDLQPKHPAGAAKSAVASLQVSIGTTVCNWLLVRSGTAFTGRITYEINPTREH